MDGLGVFTENREREITAGGSWRRCFP